VNSPGKGPACVSCRDIIASAPGVYDGWNMAHLLQNDDLSVAVVPDEGGRIASLKSRHSGLELLLQARHDRAPLQPGLHARFRDGACAGIEECLPSIGACAGDGESDEDASVPDHGDFWQLAWTVDTFSEATLSLSATGFSRPLRLRKRISLHNNSLRMDYSVENLSDRPTSFLYACHPLLAVAPGDRIALPKEVTSLRLHSSRGDQLGTHGTILPWPSTTGLHHRDLSLALHKSEGTADMLYTARLTEGWCGLYRSAARQGVALRFNPALLPYVGLWLCYGGWPEDGSEPRQYAVALEPTTAPYGTLTAAKQAGAAIQLAVGGSFHYTIEFAVSAPNISFAAFRNFCGDGS
jgi:galactose mutarotase-like enzyme